MKEIKHCPHCGQKMMVYRRNIRKNMLYCLRKLYFDFGTQAKRAIEIDTRILVGSDFTKLKYWGLIEEGVQATTYKITEQGIMFVLGKIAIPKYKWVYNKTIQPDPEDEINPMIYSWEIAPQEISKEIVLADARRYPYEPKEKDLFGVGV